MKTLLFAGAAGVLAMIPTSPAVAEGKHPLVVEVTRVAHGDLDLATTAGAEAMLKRLETAASRVCGGRPSASVTDPLGAAKAREYRRCKITAIDLATVRLDAPLVRAAWQMRPEAGISAEARRASADMLREAGLDVPPEMVRG